MIRNFIKTAVRSLLRNKSYAIINVLGLAIGIAACLLIFLVIQFETSFDKFHPLGNKIYRVGTELHSEDGLRYTGAAPFPTAGGLRRDFPQLEGVAAIFGSGGQITIDNPDGTQKKLNDDLYYAEPEFFNLFNFPFLVGSAKTSLADPYSVVLTKATAEKFFGDWRKAMGRTIRHENRYTYKVTGILKDIPVTTDFPLNAIVPYSALEHTYLKENLTDWVSTYGGAYTFVVLPPNYPAQQFNTDLKAFTKKYKPEHYAKDAATAQSLMEMHYDDRFGNFRNHTFSHELVKSLALIGIFLLVIACVNFINLATAQAVNRSKEVGVRKVLGSSRRQLGLQFIGETAMIVVFALLLSVLIAELCLPFLNELLQTKISSNFFSNPYILLFLLILAVLATLLSGVYPAMVLSSFNPITALKSKVNARMVGGLSLRRVLVVLQFVIAHALIIGVIVVVAQMKYFRTASMGFDKAAIINLPFPNDSTTKKKIDFVKNQLMANPNILSVSFSLGSPSSDNNWSSDFKFDHADKATNFAANLKWADPDYFKTFGLTFVAGGPFQKADTVREFVVNETLLKKLGITDPQKAIGKEINFWDRTKANIVGVVKDFNVYSLRRPMAAVVMGTWQDVYQTINVKIRPGSEKATLAFLEKTWTTSFPDAVYDYSFMDKTIENFYRQENQLSQLYKIFAGIAIFISCLGLYGLVSFMAVQRTKEVGIRKVLGATASHIVYLFSKEFTVLILIAFLIAAPLSWYFMNNWLQDFTYRIKLGAGVFLLAILGSIVIAWITVGYRAVSAAFANPVKSLRTE